MSVIFESKIKLNPHANGWQIELKDTMDGRVIVCDDLEEYQKSIEELGMDYGGNIDEVKWSVAENVPPYFVDEVRLAMAKYQEENPEENTNDTNDR